LQKNNNAGIDVDVVKWPGLD